jgi:hypothetical protein
LKDVWFARKKQKIVLNVAANAKTETRMKQTRNFAEFWSSLFAEAHVTYLRFILLTLQILTKLKTQNGHLTIINRLQIRESGIEFDSLISGGVKILSPESLILTKLLQTER